MARRIIEFPIRPPKLPEKLPGEDAISQGVERALGLMERDPILGLVNRLIEKIPVIPERAYSTPLGNYKTPEFYIPRLTPARFDGRQREAFKAAVMNDLSALVEIIPTLGIVAAPLADAIGDTAMAKIQDTLTPAESQLFRSYDKVDPLSTIAMIRTMVRTQKER